MSNSSLQLGYVIGKFVGIFVVPTIAPSHRFPLLLSLPVISTTVWLLLALLHDTGPSTVFLCFFVSAMPLSMAWSLLYRYLEGRNHSDVLGAILSASIIIGSAIAKTIGGSLVSAGLSIYWMPFVASLIYLIPFLGFAFLVQATPEPSATERRKMNSRYPLSQSEKFEFFRRHWIGLVSMTLGYMLLTSARDYRDTFTVDIFEELSGEEEESVSDLVFLLDVPVGIFVCGVLVMLTFIEDNAKNVLCEHGIMFGGYFLLIFFQLLFSANIVGNSAWYMGIGVGTYLAYTPVAAMFYDRIGGALPAAELVGTATFMIQLSDFSGYIGTVLLYSFQGFGLLTFGVDEDSDGFYLDYYRLFSLFVIVVGCFGMGMTAISFTYWRRTLLVAKVM